MRIALTGNPNSGKTTMYNALTGQFYAVCRNKYIKKIIKQVKLEEQNKAQEEKDKEQEEKIN